MDRVVDEDLQSLRKERDQLRGQVTVLSQDVETERKLSSRMFAAVVVSCVAVIWVVAYMGYQVRTVLGERYTQETYLVQTERLLSETKQRNEELMTALDIVREDWGVDEVYWADDSEADLKFIDLTSGHHRLREGMLRGTISREIPHCRGAQ